MITWPAALKILFENNLSHQQEAESLPGALEGFRQWTPDRVPDADVWFWPGRVLMQDYTGIPALVDLAACRHSVAEKNGAPARIDARIPVDLVVDHSIITDTHASPDAAARNRAREYERNTERFRFIRWASKAFKNVRVFPPGSGICHQINLEQLATVVTLDEQSRPRFDTVVGTDSHTTMVNGLGVLGWGVGGLEAEAAMLGRPLCMAFPTFVGVELTGALPPGCTATDLALSLTHLLRQRGVVGAIVEFHGPGMRSLSLSARATVANMSPEFGSTAALFPIDEETLRYLRATGRDEALVARVGSYAKAQGVWHGDGWSARYNQQIQFDLSSLEPTLAGPRRPQDRLRLQDVPATVPANANVSAPETADRPRDGQVVIAAITSCTNTSNPEVLLCAGLLAKKAVSRGLRPHPWVKTSFSPGSRAVEHYLRAAGLLEHLETLGFHIAGFGCMTCNGNSGPLVAQAAAAAARGTLTAAVISGNRNFDARIHPDVRLNYLASPPLVVAYALAGSVCVDLSREPLGLDPRGQRVYLRDLWPSQEDLSSALQSVTVEAYTNARAKNGTQDPRWASLTSGITPLYGFDQASTYIRRPPFLEDLPVKGNLRGARALLFLGDSVTTDHISPVGSISPGGPAGAWLSQRGIPPAEFNSFGTRRGNHEVMSRGTFSNIRLKNRLTPEHEGGVTRHFPSGEILPIFDAAQLYRREGVPLLLLAGRDYGSGSSRDWAAKGSALLGVRCVLAQSFERIHRSNLVNMGVLPLEFLAESGAEMLGLTGRELFTTYGLEQLDTGAAPERVVITADEKRFEVRVRLDTAQEMRVYLAGGLLPEFVREALQ